MKAKKPTKVQKLVYAMLTENTGSSLGDSGGIYGRHHERNVKKTIEDFMSDEAVSYEVSDDDWIERSVSVFHFLSNLELDKVCDGFNKRNKDAKDWDGEWHGVSKRAEKFIGNIGVEPLSTWNTYNGDSDLSQTLQGMNLSVFVDGQFADYMLVQVHGGCDVRGGYTDAKLFKVCDDFYNIREWMSQEEAREELSETTFN
jgi:hypothetical protein